MAILVDQARWPWRGTTWCHLVSDSHLDELHDFAGGLGCRRVGFQGDHYDIDIETRELAIANGALALDSRELVRRLKAAGLRLRPSQFAKWELHSRGDGGLDEESLGRLLLDHKHLGRIMGDVLEEDDIPSVARIAELASGFFALERGEAEAVVIYGEGALGWATERPDIGIFARTDHQERWAIESFSPAPTAQE